MWREGVSPTHFTRGAGFKKCFGTFKEKQRVNLQNLEKYRGKIRLKSPVHAVKKKKKTRMPCTVVKILSRAFKLL